MAGKWKMITAFGKAIGKKVGKPNKTSKMIEGVGESRLDKNVDEWDAFNAGRNGGISMKEAATDEAYQAMYDRLDDNAKAVFDAYDMDFERSYGPKGAYREAIRRAGVDPNDVPNDLNAWQERFGFDITEPAPRKMDVAKRTERLAGKESDKALEETFDKGFEDAAERHGYNKWREESKDMPLNDGFGGDMHDVNRMDAEQRVREEMIRDKHTLSDDEFFDKWFNK